MAYYITAHGYGHGARSCDVLRALETCYPDLHKTVVTDLPEDFLQSRLKDLNNISFRRGAFDVGLVQSDSLRSDLPATLAELERIYGREAELIEQEKRFLSKNRIGLVASDIPAIPLAAAQQLGLPNMAIGNFSWDWIYEDFAGRNPRWRPLIEKFSPAYARTDLLLKLPFAPAMEVFPNQTGIPLLARPGTPRREKIRNSIVDIHASDFPPRADKPWVLLSFTSLDLENGALKKIAALRDEYEFFSVQPLEWPGSCVYSIDWQQVSFSDILASCDIVVSKPGFGLVSECIVNQKPLIYADRGDFAEYPYLVDGIEKYLQNVYIPSGKLYAGELGPYLKALKTAPLPVEKMPSGGAELIAHELIRCGGW